MRLRKFALSVWTVAAVAACGSSVGSASPGSSTPGSSTPGATLSLAAGPSLRVVPAPPLPSPAKATCTEAIEQGKTDRVSLPAISVPKKTACQDTYLQTDLIPKFDLLNDGPLVAFVAEGFDTIYLGDLSTGSLMKVPHDSYGDRSRMVAPQLVGGHLYWAQISDIADPSWRLMDMDVATLTTTTIATYTTREPTAMVTDGNHFAWVEPVEEGGDFPLARLETRTLTDPTLTSIDLGDGNDADLVHIAIADDGLLYDTVHLTDIMAPIVGPATLWHWKWGQSPVTVATSVWNVAVGGGREALRTGDQTQHVLTGTSPFTTTVELERGASSDATVESIVCDTNVVAWLEAWWDATNVVPAGQFDSHVRSVSVWMPGWKSPMKLDTGQNRPWLISSGGGWLVWVENQTMDHTSRVRGLPIATLATLAAASGG